MLKSYISKRYEIASRGDAREEGYYSVLEVLERVAESKEAEYLYNGLPKNTEAGTSFGFGTGSNISSVI